MEASSLARTSSEAAASASANTAETGEAGSPANADPEAFVEVNTLTAANSDAVTACLGPHLEAHVAAPFVAQLESWSAPPRQLDLQACTTAMEAFVEASLSAANNASVEASLHEAHHAALTPCLAPHSKGSIGTSETHGSSTSGGFGGVFGGQFGGSIYTSKTIGLKGTS